MASSRDYELPARTVRVTVANESVAEVDGFQDRVARVDKILRKLAKDPEPSLINTIPVSFTTPGMARELARIWDSSSRLDKDAQVVAKVQKIQKLASSLLAHQIEKMASSGISQEMIRAIIEVAQSNLYEKGSEPKRGHPKNTGALRLSETFAIYYPYLTGRDPGVNQDHDFVATLGEIFQALDFKAKPQHFAKAAVKAFEDRRPMARSPGSRVQTSFCKTT